MYSTLKKIKIHRKISIAERNSKKQSGEKHYYLKTNNRFEDILDCFDYDFLIKFSKIGLSSNKKESSQVLPRVVLKLESEKTNHEILTNEK